MADRIVAGVLTLRGEGASPRLVYAVDIEMEERDTPLVLADYLSTLIGHEASAYFTLSAAEHGEGAYLIVRTERIESLIITPGTGDTT